MPILPSTSAAAAPFSYALYASYATGWAAALADIRGTSNSEVQGVVAHLHPTEQSSLHRLRNMDSMNSLNLAIHLDISRTHVHGTHVLERDLRPLTRHVRMHRIMRA